MNRFSDSFHLRKWSFDFDWVIVLKYFLIKIRNTILSSRMNRTLWGVLHEQCVHTHLQIYQVSRLSLTGVKRILLLINTCMYIIANRGLRAHLPKISHRLAHRLITWLTVSPRGSPSLFLNKWGTDSGSRLTTLLISSPNLLTMVLHPTYRFTAWLTCSPNLLTRFLHLTQRLSTPLSYRPSTWLSGSLSG